MRKRRSNGVIELPAATVPVVVEEEAKEKKFFRFEIVIGKEEVCVYSSYFTSISVN